MVTRSKFNVDGMTFDGESQMKIENVLLSGLCILAPLLMFA
ncbi:hypothetical protein VCHENC03_2067 [Vibrio sp. HENC-03]|nr:hypothetical protein VCHENC03_2067 [Vibrio sp. HENC-03]